MTPTQTATLIVTGIVTLAIWTLIGIDWLSKKENRVAFKRYWFSTGMGGIIEYIADTIWLMKQERYKGKHA